MAKNHILLVDGNSITHACHNATALTVGGMQVQAIFGVLKSLRVLLRDTPGQKKLLVLWDGKAQFRLDLHPGYKGNRAPMDAKQEAHRAAFKKQTPILEAILSSLGVQQVRSPLLEADDLAGLFVPMMEARGNRVTMISGDRDWLQMVSPDTTWFDPINNRRVDEDNFFNFTGYQTTNGFLQGKALQGDNSDNIDGIPWMGEKTASLLIAKWGTVERFFEAVDAGTYSPKVSGPKAVRVHPETTLASAEGRANFERNVKLMDWRLSRKPVPGELIYAPCTPDADKFRLWCERLAFASILREFDSFTRTFGINTTKEIA